MDSAAWASHYLAIIGVILSILSLLAVLVAYMAWQAFKELKEEIQRGRLWREAFVVSCGVCKLDQVDRFISKDDFSMWKAGRNGPGGLWEAINHHRHEGSSGGVVRDK
jgi:hypothetical protein